MVLFSVMFADNDSEPGQGTVPDTCESKVNVNCAETGLALACCCKRLIFS